MLFLRFVVLIVCSFECIAKLDLGYPEQLCFCLAEPRKPERCQGGQQLNTIAYRLSYRLSYYQSQFLKAERHANANQAAEASAY